MEWTSFPVQAQKRKRTLPTQALSCSGSKGLSQPDLANHLTLKPVQASYRHPWCVSFIIFALIEVDIHGTQGKLGFLLLASYNNFQQE